LRSDKGTCNAITVIGIQFEEHCGIGATATPIAVQPAPRGKPLNPVSICAAAIGGKGGIETIDRCAVGVYQEPDSSAIGRGLFVEEEPVLYTAGVAEDDRVLIISGYLLGSNIDGGIAHGNPCRTAGLGLGFGKGF